MIGDTEPGRAGLSPGLSLALDVLAAELAGANGREAALLGTVYLIGLGDARAARAWLERSLATRDGFRAMALCAAAAGDRDALAALGARAPRRACAASDLAEIWLYQLGDPGQAAAAAPAGGDLLRVALALAGRDAELETELAAGDSDDIAAAAALAWDLEQDDQRVPELVRASGDDLSLLALAVEVAAAIGSSDREIAAIDALSAALARRDPDSPTAAALRFQLAERVGAAGDTRRAAAIYAELADSAGLAEAVGPHLALRGQLRSAVVAGDRGAVAASYWALAARAERGDDRELAAVYYRRAAQTASGATEIASWKSLLALRPGDRGARVALEVLGARGGPEAHVSMLCWLAAEVPEIRGRALRGAAAIAGDQLGDTERAAALIAEAVAADPLAELGQLLALWSAALGEPGGVATAVEAWIERVVEPSDAALAAAAAMAINAGASDLTLCMLGTAGGGVVVEALAGAALADAGRWAELAETWTELLAALAAPRARQLIAAELARVAVTELGDLDRAGAAIEAAREAGAPGAALASLEAAVFRAAGDLGRAAASLEAALADLETGDVDARLTLLVELAEVELEGGDPARAMERIAAARSLGPRHPRLLAAWARAARAAGDDAALLGALRAWLEVTADRAGRLELTREIAAVAGPAEAVDAHAAVLRIDPGDRQALAAILELAGGSGDWERVADVFFAAPESPPVLEGRARALRALARWSELAMVLERRLELSHTNPERADVATELAELYDGTLDEPDAAARLYREAAGYSSDDPERRSALIAVLDAQGRWSELAAVLASEVGRARGPARIDAALRLAEILRLRLDRAGDAAEVLEALLGSEPPCEPALIALESIYDQLGRDADLLRVLERRGGAAGRSALLSRRIANLRAAAGDIDGALAAHAEAFAADPGDRATSAAIERLCREHHRFGELVDHYEEAAAKSEGAIERAEYLARKGEVELRYLGELGAALESLAAAVELDPGNAGAFELATAACTRARRWARLTELCGRRATCLDGAERLALLRRAAQITSRHLDDRERSRGLDRRLLEAGERDPVVLDEIETRAVAARDWELLVVLLERRLEHARDGDATIALHERIATIASEQLLDEQRAIAHYTRILEIAPSRQGTLEALARVLESTEEWSRFLEVTERLIEVTADADERALLLFKCGSVLEARFGDDERAIGYYRKALDASAGCMPAVHGLRDLFRRRGDFARVVETLELETSLWTEPRERAGIYAQIGSIYGAELAQPRRALDYFESALAVDPDSLPANLALFEHYFVTGNWKRALPLADRMSRKAVRAGDPRTRSEFYRRRGVVLRYSGRPGDALDSVLVALEIDPENPAALDALLELAATYGQMPEVPDLALVYDELESVYRRRDGAGALLARVLVGRARIAVNAGDLEAAGARFSEALALAPRELAVLEAYVGHRLELGDPGGALAALEAIGPGDGDGLLLCALLRRAEISADVALDDEAARELWHRALEIDGECLEALYRLAAVELAAGDHEAAGVAIERAIDVAAAPGRAPAAAELARYYHLLGVVREIAGDDRAVSAFRRAADHDPCYPEPSIALARRAVRSGDREGARTLLVGAAHRAMAGAGNVAAVPLQRELARVLAADGDRAAAAEAYRGILAVAPSPADRIALAELFAAADPSRAAAELEPLFAEAPMFGPAYGLAASYHDRAGAPVRAWRALSAQAVVGIAGDADLAAATARRQELGLAFPLRPLTARQRGALLSGSPDPILDRAYRELAPALGERFPLHFAGADLIPFERAASPTARAASAQIAAAMGGSLELAIGRGVPGGIVVASVPQPRAVIDVEIATGPDAELRFALGWAHEVGFRRLGPLLCGPPERRRQVAELLSELIAGAATTAGIGALRHQLSPGVVSLLAKRRPDAASVSSWIDFIALVPCRAGLLFADDLSAAAAVLERLAGNPVRGAPMLSALDPATAPLVAYYLGAAHNRLHAAICSPPAGIAG